MVTFNGLVRTNKGDKERMTLRVSDAVCVRENLYACDVSVSSPRALEMRLFGADEVSAQSSALALFHRIMADVDVISADERAREA